ncbi:MAG: 2-hydroxycyclohexanecarboxyl-CoA dehydrogenase [Proteobacteria bacterium]|nr:MAG: 2-hydroxycyclohexanecarboxyl-CoA dehydrogenase [Pseudomonadota bacterium]
MHEAKRVALVTGGAGGIGAAVCRALAAQGRAVAVADLDVAGAALVAAEIGGLGVALDVTDPAAVEHALGEVRAKLGPVAVLVSCAGWDEMRPFADTDEAFQARVLDVNLAGPIRVLRAALPDMRAQRFGRVVLVSSDAARVGSSGEAIYAAAKGGLIALAKSVAREAVRDGVTANCVCPGPTDTPLFRGLAQQSDDGDRITQALERAIPMRRLGLPGDVAPAIAFLASDEAGYITGQTLSVSGGLTMV